MFKKINNKQNNQVATIQASNQDYIISAKEANKLAEKQWGNFTDEEIFKKIRERAEAGERNAYFFEAYLIARQYGLLKEQGYTVYINTSEGNAPYFRVSW